MSESFFSWVLLFTGFCNLVMLAYFFGVIYLQNSYWMTAVHVSFLAMIFLSVSLSAMLCVTIGVRDLLGKQNVRAVKARWAYE